MKKLRIFLVSIGFRPPVSSILSPPLGIMHLAAYLRSRFDADIRLINQKERNISADEIVFRIKEFNADVVGISVITPSSYLLPYISHQIRKVLPGSLIVAGGPHVSAFGAAVLQNTALDAAVPGEGEIVFERIIQNYFDGSGLENVPGIFRRDGDMIIANSGEVPLIEDLDSLPVPAYDLIDLPFYWKETRFFLNSGSRYASLFSSRGCPYKCFYCHRIFGKQFRYQSAERIVSEIKYLKKKYNINDIEFLDDVFNLYRPRMIDFCEKLPRQVPGIKIALPNGVRTDILKFEDIDALAEAGLYYCSFALESGSPRIQKLIGKELDISKFKKNVDYAAKKRIFTNGFTMLGFPSETGSDIQMTIDVACNSLLHLCSFFTATPFANTVMYEMAKSRCPERLARLRYDNMEYGDVFINLSDVPDEELFRYQRAAWRRFYLKPSRIMRIIRDYPNPLMIPFYVPILLKRLTRGLFRKSF